MANSIRNDLCRISLVDVCSVLAIFFWIYPLTLHGEVVHLTILTAKYTNIETTTGSQYQCYRSDSDEDAALEFGRAAPIAGSSEPDPPAHIQHNSFTAVRKVVFPDTTAWNVDGFGPFYCQGMKAGKDVTKITTFFKRSDAKFEPSDGVFTRTVNVGDRDINFSMNAVSTPDSPDNEISWRKDGGSKQSSREGLLMYTFADPIQSSDEGIYEIHYNTERTDGTGALYRIIVRDCAAGKWGPPTCHGVCDKCYNGGVCDDQSGLCICPNNFKGPNCLEICRSNGGNRFGHGCDYRCTYNPNDPATTCHGKLFCLPDPYGCSCDVGVKGLDCSTLCTGGKFGAGCTQMCHCANAASCSGYTGECDNQGCETGFSGVNCQIPNVCDVGYYGTECADKCHCLNDAVCDKSTGECPNQDCSAGFKVNDGQVNCQECDGAFYGLECTEACHCQEASCDKVTGICNGNCLSNWIEEDCQTGISNLTNMKVNPNQPSSFTCTVEGDPVPDEASVMLKYLNETNIVTDGITRVSSTTGTSERHVLFTVESVISEGTFYCFLTTAFFSVSAKTYVLPVLGEAPSVTGTSISEVNLTWTPWNEGVDAGDPPIVEYVVYSRVPSGDWTVKSRVDQAVTSTTVTGLDPDTDYEFSVAAAREGEGGTGPINLTVGTVTDCGKPSALPTGLSASANDPGQIEVTWQAPDAATSECRSGYSHYVIYYASKTGASESNNTDDDLTTSITLTGLDPYLEYDITISAANKDSVGDPSEKITQTTLEEIAPPPESVLVSASTMTSLTITWSAASPKHLNGKIMRYEVSYHVTGSDDSNPDMVDVEDTSLEGSHTIENLDPQLNYTLMVRTVNGQGGSEWSKPAYGKTVDPPKSASVVAAAAGGAIGALLVIVILIVFVILVLRRRGNERKTFNANDTKGDTKPRNDMSQVIYANDGVDIQEENTYEGIDIEKPPIASRTSKPIAQPRTSSQNINGKPVAMVLPATVESRRENQKPPPVTPYADYVKEQDTIALQEIGKESSGKADVSLAPRKSRESLDNIDSGGRTSSQDNLDEVANTALDEGEIYANVTNPQTIPIAALEDYIRNKKIGDTNELVHEFNLLKKDQLNTWVVASQEKNKAKNRFRNIIAYDHSRVVLEKINGDPYSDYYNANYLKDYKGNRVFIGSQAPNTASLTAFWRMIWQENVATIVMVTNLIENGKDRCRQYWPKKSVEDIGDLSLFLSKTEQFSDHVVREIIVKKGHDDDELAEKRVITQFHYLSWPDMGVPEYYTTLINFTEMVKEHHVMKERHTKGGPMLVHCSAGVGRTGTFITLYNMLDMMRETGKIDIFAFVSQMREDRIKMVQTADQYVFLYNAVLEVYLSGNTAVPVSKFRDKLSEMNRANPRTNKANIQVEYENLAKLTPEPAPNSFRGGCDPKNRSKNRFQDIIPMEKNRPYLATAGGDGSTDYINASFVNTFVRKDAFLATQSPLPATVDDIWRLVFDWKCPIIVMLNDLDPSDPTCVQYWPDEGSQCMGSLEVTITGAERGTNFITRTFRVSNQQGEVFDIEHYQLLGWSASHNKPDSPLSLLHLVDAVENTLKTSGYEGAPIVHCINGIGRSGVFCALWNVMEKIRLDDKVDIFQAVKRLRASRPNMVDTLDQYQLCYEVISQHLERFDEYANLDML